MEKLVALVFDDAGLLTETITEILVHAGFDVRVLSGSQMEAFADVAPRPQLVVMILSQATVDMAQAAIEHYRVVPTVVVGEGNRRDPRVSGDHWAYLEQPFGLDGLVAAIAVAREIQSSGDT